jgi:hypothetical protein
MYATMAHTCPTCAYTTDDKNLYKRHQARKTPCSLSAAKVNAFECTKCCDTFLTDRTLAVHSRKCDGVKALQCPTCHVTLKDRVAKSRHIKKRGCTTDMRVAITAGNVVQGVGIINGDHNTINNVTINCTPAQKEEIVSFMDTDLDAVVELILKDPSRFQLALQNGSLHQELCKATHFGDIAANRNVLGVQEKGVSMRVIQDGQKMTICKAQGISRIISNNHKIATDDKTVEYFGKDSIKRGDRVRQQISRVVQNKGGYLPVLDVAKGSPKGRPQADVRASMLEDFKTALVSFHQFSEYELIVPFGIKTFQHFLVFEGGQWWRSVNDQGGWAACDDARGVITGSVLEYLETVKEHVAEVKSGPGVDRDLQWHCKDVEDALEYLRPAAFANLVYSSL